MIKIQLKTKLSLLFILSSVIAALLVAGIAYWYVMRDFNQAVQDQSFKNFSSDVQAYLNKFGSWERAEASVPFHYFVRQRRGPYRGPNHEPEFSRKPHLGGLPKKGGKPAPFKFLLTTPEGVVVKPQAEFKKGNKIENSLLLQGYEILHNNQVALVAIPLGIPNLSADDKRYLYALRNALIIGTSITVILAIILGWWMGRRIGRPLNELTQAIESMGDKCEFKQNLPVYSQDEIGKLTQAFNSMSNELAKTHDELHEASIRDPLTSLHNRRYFSQKANALFQQASVSQQPLCVVLADVDHFKKVNDNFSHQVGDAVLQRLSQILQHNIRRDDELARFGGEEFAIILPNTSLAQAKIRCEEIRKAVEADSQWQEIQPELKVTLSIGICAEPSLGNIDRMLNDADVQLYKAKHAGRNCIRPEI